MKRPRCGRHNAPIVMMSLPLATLFLTAHVLLDVAALTGENVCHIRETYNVTLNVRVKEPIQVKTYTWCLKVPPRCTKFKVEMKDRLKVQTEMRERVVDVCCAGHVPDQTGTSCIPVCRGCVHGVCAAPDTCYCNPGYIGEHCDTECGEGLWGSACKQQCHCENGATCNHVTGECKCAEGWKGDRCDITCPEGTYGHDCKTECYCEAGDDAENSTCHHVTGECMLLGNPTNENQETNTHQSTTVPPTSSPYDTDSDVDTYSVLKPTEHIVTGVEDMSTPSAEKQINSDMKFAALMTNTFISTVTTSSFTAEKTVKPQISDEYTSSSATNIVPLHDDQSSSPDSETERKQIHDTNFSREGQESERTKINTETGNLQPQNIEMPPHGRPIIVISDSLLSERRDERKKEDSKDGILYLVCSVILAGGVAISLIIMAAVILFLSHHRKKANVRVSENEMAPIGKQQLQQQQPPPAPKMYGYTEEVTTCPVQHFLPDMELRPLNGVPGPDALQLSFGNVSSTMTTNSNLGHPYHMYNNARAYLELQYDIPPSSISSRSNSLPPGMEPEHLYDEIPCWKSITTTSTNTDTSRC